MSHALNVDEIVKRILQQLQSPSAAGLSVQQPDLTPAISTVKQPKASLPVPLLHDQVITASVLEDRLRATPLTNLRITEKAIVTPAAVDFAKDKGLTLIRGGLQTPAATATSEVVKPVGSKAIVTITQSDWASSMLNSQATMARNWNQILADNFEQAIELLTTDMSRAALSEALVVTDRAAELSCRLNRCEAIRAVVLNGFLDLGFSKAFDPNVWCWQPVESSFMETRKLLQSILTSTKGAKR